MSTQEHKALSPKQVTCMVITVSDTRTEETDKSGQLMKQLLEEAGHAVALYRIVRDEPAQVVAAIESGIAHDQVQVILLNGGTGISRATIRLKPYRAFWTRKCQDLASCSGC